VLIGIVRLAIMLASCIPRVETENVDSRKRLAVV
jgi:hypothetical protein